MIILHDILKKLKNEFAHSRKGSERGIWFVYTIIAIVVPFTSSKTSNILRCLNSLFGFSGLRRKRFYTFMASPKILWKRLWLTLWKLIPDPLRASEENKSTEIAPDLGPSSRRAKGSIFVICDFWRNAEDGPKDKQDCLFIFFRGPKLNLGLRPSDPKRFGPIQRDNESVNGYFNIERPTSNVQRPTSNDEIASLHLSIDDIFCLSFLSKIEATYFKNDRIPYSKFDPPEADKCLLASGEFDVQEIIFRDRSLGIRMKALQTSIIFRDPNCLPEMGCREDRWPPGNTFRHR